MTMLATAAIFFLAIHLLVAGTTLRDAAVRAVGERAYLGIFSLASVVGIVWLSLSYNAASAEGSAVWWDFGPGIKHLGTLVMAVAFLLGVSGLLTPSPTAAGMESRAADPNTVRGVLRITRHPFLWSVALWSAFHLTANGDAASAVFFGTFLVLSVAGTASIDAKRARKMGTDWQGFAARTSNVPFAAILSGRATFELRELISYRLAVAVAAFVAVLFLHAWAFSASPFPGGWVPF
ncbi:MAG: NnrU family protein [Micropepsaceae bacterium]